MQEHILQSQQRERKLDLVCFGNPTVDTIITPTQKHIRPGGAAMNTAAAFIGLSGKAGVIGRIGTDKIGNFLIEKMKEAGVDIKRLRVDDKPTFTNDIIVAPDKRDIICTNNYYGVDTLIGDDMDYILQSGAVLIGLRSKLFMECAEFTTKSGIPLYVSAHQYVTGASVLQEIYLAQYNIEAVIGDDKEINTMKRLCKTDPAVPLVITRGSTGSVFSFLKQDVLVEAKSYKVNAVDPTGAGDAFAAGYIFADMRGMGPAECLALGNACGAITVQGYGAQQPITAEAVKALLGKTE